MTPKIAIRIVAIKQGKVLLVSNDRDNFHYFIGGKLEYQETIEECIQRELREETGMNVAAKLLKFLYLQELLVGSKDKHKVELFILVDIDKFEELEGLTDPDHDGTDHLTWVDIYELPENLLPKAFAKRLSNDYKAGFEGQGLPHFIEKR